MPKVGCNDSYAVEFAAKAVAISPTLKPDACRIFVQSQAWSTNPPWKNAIDANARGEQVLLTFKPAGLVTSDETARVTAIANGIKATGIRNGVIGEYHEPEDNVAKGEYTAAQWCAMQVKNLAILKGILGPLGWRTCVCLMGWTADPSSNRRLTDYLTSAVLNVVDVIAWDPYWYAGGGGGADQAWATTNPSTKDPASIFGFALDASKTYGKTPMVFETGCLRRQSDTNGAERTAWWNKVAAYSRMAEFEAITHFENTPVYSNTAIRNEPASLTAFLKLKGAVTPPPPPPDPCADELAATRAELATADAEVASLTDQNRILATSLDERTTERDTLIDKIAKAKADLA